MRANTFSVAASAALFNAESWALREFRMATDEVRFISPIRITKLKAASTITSRRMNPAGRLLEWSSIFWIRLADAVWRGSQCGRYRKVRLTPPPRVDLGTGKDIESRG